MDKDIYAQPRLVTDLNECFFYHTMDIPGYGCVKGPWDLRGRTQEYLGGVNFQGKRVLEVGTASGFLCFYMESQGAEVVALDVSEEQSWDTRPPGKFSAQEYEELLIDRKKRIRLFNNSFWLAHRAYGSRARMVYASTYAIPQEIGPVDISTFSSILEHLRDPFLALQNALRLTRETVIITEFVGSKKLRLASAILHLLGERAPLMLFTHDYRNPGPPENWWTFSIDILTNFIGALGFEKYEVHRSTIQSNNGSWGGGHPHPRRPPNPGFTLGGERVAGSAESRPFRDRHWTLEAGNWFKSVCEKIETA